MPTIKAEGKISLSQKPELPIDGLPASIREYINAVCDVYHCPREFVTASVLATAATAVGKRIRINEGKYKNNLVLTFQKLKQKEWLTLTVHLTFNSSGNKTSIFG